MALLDLLADAYFARWQIGLYCHHDNQLKMSICVDGGPVICLYTSYRNGNRAAPFDKKLETFHEVMHVLLSAY